MASTYSGNLAFSIEVGQVLVIGGRTLKGANRLDINLAKTKSPHSEMPLHLSIRFNENMIVRNSLKQNGWGIEERYENLHDTNRPNPIIPGETFKVYISITDNKFQISINDIQYCTYQYRVDLNQINAVYIDKDLESIHQIDHRQIYPFMYPTLQFDDDNLQFSNDTPKAFSPGHVMIVTGTPHGNPNGRFVLYFTEEKNPKKQLLHFNPRFEQNIVVRNSSNPNGVFYVNEEEHSGGFPFHINQEFKLAIGFTETSFKFAVNGSEFPEFQFRSGHCILSKLNGLKCLGEYGMKVKITSIDNIKMSVSNCRGFETYSRK